MLCGLSKAPRTYAQPLRGAWATLAERASGRTRTAPWLSENSDSVKRQKLQCQSLYPDTEALQTSLGDSRACQVPSTMSHATSSGCCICYVQACLHREDDAKAVAILMLLQDGPQAIREEDGVRVSLGLHLVKQEANRSAQSLVVGYFLHFQHLLALMTQL